MTFGTGFGKLGASFGRLGASSGGSGDPTIITAANVDALLTSLGLTQAGTGTTYGETGQDATPLYAVAANKAPLATETVIGRDWFGPIVNPAGTNLVTHSRDLTNAAWTKTGCTAALALGGLVRGADWRGPELVGDVEFDTPASWTPQNAQWEVADGKATYTKSASVQYLQDDGSTSLVAGKAYLCSFTISGATEDTSAIVLSLFNSTASANLFGAYQILSTNGEKEVLFISPVTTNGIRIYGNSSGRSPEWSLERLSIREVDAHTLLTATANNATAVLPITSTSGERVSKFWLSRGSGAGTVEITQDDGTTWAAMTLTSDPQPFNIAPATLADPDVGIRIGTSGDTVRVYGVSHQVAARNLRPFTEQTAGATATVGARTLSRTLSVAPTSVDVSMVVVVPGYAAWCWQIDDGGDTSDRIALLFDASQNLVLRKGASTDQTVAASLTPGDAILIDLQANVSVTRARVNGGSWVDNGTGAVADADTVRFGADQAGANQLGQPILAFQSGGLLAGVEDWNRSLISGWV